MSALEQRTLKGATSCYDVSKTVDDAQAFESGVQIACIGDQPEKPGNDSAAQPATKQPT